MSFSLMGSGCGSASGAVASNTRGLWFKTSHRQSLYVLSVSCIVKTKKRPGMAHFLKKSNLYSLDMFLQKDVPKLEISKTQFRTLFEMN